MIKKTSLHTNHIGLNAKMVSFAGFLMPINYSYGIQHEYDSVRKKIGLFDVSHMGQISVFGKNSLKFLQKLTINDISKIKNGDAQYNIICNESGGIKDDIIIYHTNQKYILVVNASNCDKIFRWMNLHNDCNCNINNESENFSLIALQGPESRSAISKLFNENIKLKFYKHQTILINESNILLSRTGYTGELGFEILGKHKIINQIWNKLINLGAVPCGLAVRDILRMEMKYCLYGNDISESTSPLEAGLDWVLKFSKKEFIGKKQLLKHKKNGIKKFLVSFKMIDRCIPRRGYKIYFKDSIIGEVTSGTFSLGLKTGIGIGYVDSQYSKISMNLFLNIRGKKNKGVIVKSPFINGYSLYD